jgi:hypothetical protein
MADEIHLWWMKSPRDEIRAMRGRKLECAFAKISI